MRKFGDTNIYVVVTDLRQPRYKYCTHLDTKYCTHLYTPRHELLYEIFFYYCCFIS